MDETGNGRKGRKMRYKYPLTDLLKAEKHLEKARDLICLGVSEGKCAQCVCSDTDECFINSLESVRNEIKMRRQGKSEAQER